MKEPLISDPKSGLPKTTVIADSGSGFSKLFRWFKPAPHIPRLPKEEVDRVYPGYRWRIFESAYVGYATFYLVRNNFGPVMKEVGDTLHYDKSKLGNIVAMAAISYGVGKFLMGYLSDRSNPR